MHSPRQVATASDVRKLWSVVNTSNRGLIAQTLEGFLSQNIQGKVQKITGQLNVMQ